jgi:hypothetical protein
MVLHEPIVSQPSKAPWITVSARAHNLKRHKFSVRGGSGCGSDNDNFLQKQLAVGIGQKYFLAGVASACQMINRAGKF